MNHDIEVSLHSVVGEFGQQQTLLRMESSQGVTVQFLPLEAPILQLPFTILTACCKAPAEPITVALPPGFKPKAGQHNYSRQLLRCSDCKELKPGHLKEFKLEREGAFFGAWQEPAGERQRLEEYLYSRMDPFSAVVMASAFLETSLGLMRDIERTILPRLKDKRARLPIDLEQELMGKICRGGA